MNSFWNILSFEGLWLIIVKLIWYDIKMEFRFECLYIGLKNIVLDYMIAILLKLFKNTFQIIEHLFEGVWKKNIRPKIKFFLVACGIFIVYF